MPQRTIRLRGNDGPVIIERDQSGTPRISARSMADTQLGLGYCHAQDRGMQILVMRIVTAGRSCELLRDDERMLELDLFFRRLGFARDVENETCAVPAGARACVEAYCRGIDLYFTSHRVPWELRMLGYRRPAPWTAADCVQLSRAIGYVSLAQTQWDLERFIVECVQAGIGRETLEEMFPGQLDGLDEQLLRRVKLGARLVGEELRWACAPPAMTASNNWAVAPGKSASGRALLANDPHLDIGRLPTVWYEAVLEWPSGTNGPARYAMGATMPGVPGILVGRTREVGWSVTFACMDCIDSWIEDCRAGQYRVGDQWRDFDVRRQTILRKSGAPVTACFFENRHGTLDGDASVPGLYLATRWSCGRDVAAESLDAVFRLLEATSVEQAMPLAARISNSSFNWVLADRAGNIGYQMSGRMPLRRPGVSGLVPLPGWDPANDWRGFASAEQLPRCINPPDGLIVTANDDLNHLGTLHPINAATAPYRADRIRQALCNSNALTLDDLKRVQMDVRSLQAERFMGILRPLLAGRSATAKPLMDWDCVYGDDSEAAVVFEHFYEELLREVFGRMLGVEVWDRLRRTSICALHFGHLDRILLSESSRWFGGRSRDGVWRAALARAMSHPPHPYAQTHRAMIRHMLLGGRLPRWMGFDRGPITIHGSRATPHQGQVIGRADRLAAIAPSYRFVTDMGDDAMHTSMPGGASDRRFGRRYNDRTADWLAGRYRIVRAV